MGSRWDSNPELLVREVNTSPVLRHPGTKIYNCEVHRAVKAAALRNHTSSKLLWRDIRLIAQQSDEFIKYDDADVRFANQLLEAIISCYYQDCY